jgi:hypothetical protein
MKRKQLFISILIGLAAGQIFAEGDRPFTLVNTLRVGYSDNITQVSNNEESSAFIRDMVDLSFRAALSDRTDLIFKSRFEFRSDSEDNNLYPNLYAVLTHSVSERMLIELSDKFRSGSKTSRFASGRHDYLENTVSLVPSYILSPKDSLSAPVSYTIERHDTAIEQEDTDIVTFGASWKRELSPQRTWAALHVRRIMADYINRDSTFDSTRLTAELSHTFNTEWQGNVEAGLSFDEFDRGGALGTSSGENPFFRAGLAFAPTPRTRFTGDFTHQYKESDNSTFAAETSSELRLAAQHDFTAKIMGKVTARFSESEYDAEANERGGGDETEELLDLDFRLSYQLNRINFLELGFRHREKQYDTAGRDWEENVVDVGWRVEL